MRQLAVYQNDRLAGILTELRPGEGYIFSYDSNYLLRGGPSVSVTLPKRENSYEAEKLFPFFTNMLPEGANRKAICRALKIDEEDFFGMLAAMADKDFIGSVNIRTVK